MASRNEDEVIDLDSESNIELGRWIVVQEEIDIRCHEVPEPLKRSHCATSRRELLRQSFGDDDFTE